MGYAAWAFGGRRSPFCGSRTGSCLPERTGAVRRCTAHCDGMERSTCWSVRPMQMRIPIIAQSLARCDTSGLADVD